MVELANPALSGWDSFYVIVGSSGAALIGLQFVVIALIAETGARTAPGAISAFGTPTVMHFGGALVISAIMSAPWPSLSTISIALAACGIVGIGYGAIVVYHARRQTVYKPVWQDWLWHVILPCLVYAALALAAVFLRKSTRVALFVISGTALGLLLIALHNAWDTLKYIVVAAPRGDQPNGK
jgi:hypothetical protein